MAQLPNLPSWGQGWLQAYVDQAGGDDIVRGDVGRGARWWHHLFDGVAALTEGRLRRLQDRIARQVDEIGTAFRLPGDQRERRWPSSAIPLLIGEDEWRGIAEGIVQRADLLEHLLGDIYGAGQLVAAGHLPAAAVTGSPHFWRSMIGLAVPGKHHLRLYAVDLGRGADGEWRVLADHVRPVAGAGYALENRLAATRVMGSLQTRLNIQRLAPYFSALREGLAAASSRSDPRIGLLTPGRYNPSYAEQAHLARYLGILLVEGDDLAVRDGQTFVRTIEGLKRIDALWRRLDTRFLDPLAFDSQSRIGVPGIVDAFAAGQTVIANAPGTGVVESPAVAAFLPALARRLLGESLKLPGLATVWAGQPAMRDAMLAQLDGDPGRWRIGSAFGVTAPELDAGDLFAAHDARARLKAAIARRPQDFVAQEVMRLSTMPIVRDNKLVARPFTLRAFATRDADGRWQVMPGGLAQIDSGVDGDGAGWGDGRANLIGEGHFSADCGIVALSPVEPVSLMPAEVAIRRNPGTLPSRAADNLFWLGRYIERADATLRLVRATLGGTLDADGGANLMAMTLDRLATQLIASGAAAVFDEDGAPHDENEGSIRDLAELAAAALDGYGAASVASLFHAIRAIAEGIRERLSADVWRLIDLALPPHEQEDATTLLVRATALQERCTALAGLAAENMGRTAGWRFHDLGRRVERALAVCRLVRTFAGDNPSGDDLGILLDLCDSQISYRARYMAGFALVPVRDLVTLDPFNPRGLAFQVARIREHLAALPSLRDDGIDEAQVALANEIALQVTTMRAEALSGTGLIALENRLMALSDAIGRRYFLQDAETLRAPGMTLA